MGVVAILRTLAANACVLAAGLYGCLLSGVLVAKGVSSQTEIHPVIYVGVGIAVALTMLGYGIARRLREGSPSAVALIVVGATAPAITSALSFSVRQGYWLLAVILSLVPCSIIVAAGYVHRRYFGAQLNR